MPSCKVVFGFFLASLALATSAAFAGGTHAGGHGHGHGHGHGEAPTGEPGVAAQAMRTIQVDAADNMRFTPDNVTVKQGETVRFVIHNAGQLPHEFSLGTEKELKAHYEVMKKFPGMEHAEANQISLQPGQQGEVIWRFTQSGVVHFACLHVGHYDAGMKGQVTVTAGMADAASTTTDGEVRRIDRSAGKLTLKHGPIQSLDMPAMTMVFGVADPGLLAPLKVGDKVQFVVERVQGQMVVTRIVPAD